MSKRNNIFRQKIPMEFLPLIETANALKLYLVQEIGPTSFVFKDDFDNKFKVSIGPSISCSCSKSSDHCVHTFYAMLKIFKRDKNDPMVWQNSYIDNEITELIKSRFETRIQPNQSKKVFLKHKIEKTSKKQPKHKQNQMEIDQETVCPICQEELLSNEQALTFCKKKCGNNFHIKCLKVWVHHKMSTKELITCPMCRTDWGIGVLDELVREEDNFANRFIIHKGTICQSCNMKPIKGNIYHCLFCKKYDLCEVCFKTFQHFIHDKFIMKIKKDCEWMPALHREKQSFKDKSKNLYNFCRNPMNHENLKPEDLTFEGLGNQKQEKNQNLEDNSFLYNFLIDSIPNLENSINAYKNPSLNSLQIVGIEILTVKTSCILCNENSLNLKKLFCGHVVDKNCLRKMLNSSKFCCPCDGLNFLEGLSVFNKNEEKSETIPQILQNKDNNLKKNLKRSNTRELKISVLKTIFPENKLEIHSSEELKEERKENVISNLSSQKIISDIRLQALEKKNTSQNKFRIVSTNKIKTSHKEFKTSENLRSKMKELEEFQLIGNNCLSKKT